MTKTVITPEKLDELERLAMELINNPYDKDHANTLIRYRWASNETAILVLISQMRTQDAEIARLREALERIANYRGGPRSPHISIEHCRQTARAALNKELK